MPGPEYAELPMVICECETTDVLATPFAVFATPFAALTTPFAVLTTPFAVGTEGAEYMLTSPAVAE